MGVVREYRCPSCEKTWKLWIGHGMKHGMLGRVMEAFPADIQKKILEGAGRELPLFSFNYEASVCGHCGSVVAVPVLRLIESGQTYVGRCPECGGEAEPLGESARISCPGCRQAVLQVQDTGHWD